MEIAKSNPRSLHPLISNTLSDPTKSSLEEKIKDIATDSLKNFISDLGLLNPHSKRH